jgi:hypothetical protein
MSNVATVTIAVSPVNDPPVALDDFYPTPEDTPFTIAAPGVLANDTDPELNSLTAILQTTVATGTLNFISNGSFTYTPPQDWSGTTTFTYRADDGNLTNNMSNVATVTIAVSPVNDVPTAPTNLETEGRTNPKAVFAKKPGFTAIYTDPDTLDIAISYRIQVTARAGGWTNLIWDSGQGTLATPIPQGLESQPILYAGSPLVPGQTYYWRMKFWDDDNAEGAWSSGSDSFAIF